jgi:hypothetical protein
MTTAHATMQPASTDARMRGRMGGLKKNALAADLRETTRAANSANWQHFIDQVRAVLPELDDESEIIRRAGMLRQAHMTDLARRSAQARRLRRQAEAIEAELSAEGLLDAGSDGVDIDL